MERQEYQEAVANLYEQTEGIGVVRRNVPLPDKVTGQMRQTRAFSGALGCSKVWEGNVPTKANCAANPSL
jgi:hypothetical protein